MTDELHDEWRALAERMYRSEHGEGWPGRNDMPAALHDAWEDGEFEGRPALLAWAICDAYNSAEYPSRSVDAETWVEWLGEVGYVENGERVERPDSVPTLYRAQVGDPDDELGMSWTDNRETAAFFHERHRDRGWPSYLMRAEGVRPDDVLARLHGEDFRNEDEYLLDPWGEHRVEVIDRIDGQHPDDYAREHATEIQAQRDWLAAVQEVTGLAHAEACQVEGTDRPDVATVNAIMQRMMTERGYAQA